jgi:hypothetical protein
MHLVMFANETFELPKPSKLYANYFARITAACCKGPKFAFDNTNVDEAAFLLSDARSHLHA